MTTGSTFKALFSEHANECVRPQQLVALLWCSSVSLSLFGKQGVLRVSAQPGPLVRLVVTTRFQSNEVSPVSPGS